MVAQDRRRGKLRRAAAHRSDSREEHSGKEIHVTAILCLGYLAAVSIIIATLTARYLRERLRVLLIGLPL